MALRGLFIIVTLFVSAKVRLQTNKRLESPSRRSTREITLSSVSQAARNRSPTESCCESQHDSVLDLDHDDALVDVVKEVTFMEEYPSEYPDYSELIIKTRLASRLKTQKKWTEVEMCCEGYELSRDDQDSEHCVPVCASRCHDGVCQRPNSCLCDPGYVASVDNVTRISECLPECSSGCLGGSCVAPETCTCDAGYDLSENSTDCKPSCRMTNHRGEGSCGLGGFCVAPNTCQCRDGYGLPDEEDSSSASDVRMRKKENSSFPQSSLIDCIPICEPECPTNSICILPNKCDCQSGYKPNNWLNVTECFPVCDQSCHNGFCKNPNECQCHEGYKAHESLGTMVCEPACQGNCVNGKCVLPNQCDCLSGYKKLVIQSANKSEVSANVCIPTCQNECGNGTCVAPNKCHCNPGYEFLNSSHSSWQTCRPICNPRCNDESVCVAPNHCQLHDTNVAKYPSYQARIVELSSKECGRNGSFSQINDTCSCTYRLDRSECIEQLHCAIIIVNDTEAIDEFRLLEKVVFHDQTTRIPKIYGTNIACRNECRISIFSNETLEDIGDDIEQCYAINLHDKKTGIVFNITENLVPISGKKSNESFICFVNDGFRCDVPKYEERKTGGVVSTGVIAAAIFLVTVIFALALSIFLTRKKIWKRLRDSSRKNETVIQKSETADSPFYRADASHL